MLQTLEPTLSQLLHCLSFLLHLQSFGKRYLPSVYTPHFLQTNWVPAVWHLPLWSSEIALTKGINTSISLNPDDAFQVLTLLYMPSFLRAFLVLSQLWPGCLPSSPTPQSHWALWEAGTKDAEGSFLGINTFPHLPLKAKPVRRQVL